MEAAGPWWLSSLPPPCCLFPALPLPVPILSSRWEEGKRLQRSKPVWLGRGSCVRVIWVLCTQKHPLSSQCNRKRQRLNKPIL